MNGEYTFTTTIRVRYSETDQMKIVYNANYLDWFEIARTELCRKWGRPYTEWEAHGLMLPVVEAYCRYKSPAHYDDRIELWARITEVKCHSVKFEYRVTLADGGRLLAEGWTKHGCTDPSGKLYKKEHPFYLWVKSLEGETA